MKRTILAVLVFFLTINLVNAQLGFGKIEDIKRLKEVPLLAVLQTKSENAIKRISKSKNGDLEKYYSDLEAYNSSLKKGFENSWNFSTEVKFVTPEELEKYNSKTNKRKYAYFKIRIKKGDNGFSLLKIKGLITTYIYALYLTGEKKPVFAYMYSSPLPNAADFKFISQQIQNYLKGRESLKSGVKSKKELISEFNDNAHKIKDKTLLLNKEDISDGLIEEIKNIYKYQYKLTNKEEIDEAILNNDNNKVYLKIVPVGQLTDSSGPLKVSKLMFVQYIMNAENGEILAYVRPSSFGLGGAIGTALKNSKKVMKVKDLKSLIKKIRE